MATLTAPITMAPSATLTCSVPSANPAARLSRLSANAVTISWPRPMECAGWMPRPSAGQPGWRSARKTVTPPRTISRPAPIQRASWPMPVASPAPMTRPTMGMPASNTPNASATRSRVRAVTPPKPIPMAAARLDSPTETATSRRGSMGPG